MSAIIEANNSSFVIFGCGSDETSPDSGTGEIVPAHNYCFKYDVMRPMQTYTEILSQATSLNLEYVDFTSEECYFKLPPLEKTSLISEADIMAWIETITDVNGGSSPNPSIGSVVPISRTDTEKNVLGLVHFYTADNYFYRFARWVEYDRSVGHWVPILNTFIVSYGYNDVADDNSMEYTIINDEASNDEGMYFKFVLHHENPQYDQFANNLLSLGTYDFYSGR